MRLAVRVFSVLFFFLFSFFLAAPFAHGQTQTQALPADPYSTNNFNHPNVDPNVPINQHTFAQSILIEVMAALSCQLAGIDPINLAQPCLSINPQTNRLGYGPSPMQDGELQIGGLIGVGVNMISSLYTPTTSTNDYIRYLSSNFGITKPAYAAPTSAFEGLAPILPLWVASRNIAYFLIMLASIFIGLGVMLRVKIDPRTVMTIQNQIPRVIIALLLITFSYAIGAVMADIMWTVTYAGINQLTAHPNSNQQGINPYNTKIPCADNMTVNSQATNTILQTPMNFVNSIFIKDCRFADSGLLSLTSSISLAMGDLLETIIRNLFGIKPETGCFDFKPPLPGASLGGPIGTLLGFAYTNRDQLNPGACFGAMLNFFTTTAMLLIVFIAIMISLFRIWFSLLKAYIYIFIYIITAPVWIVFGLLPGRPLGFEKWIRGYFVNLLLFPLTAFLLVGARVFLDVFNTTPQDKFIPPLIGNPNMESFGALIAFGFIMIAPTLQDILREKMKVPSIKQGAAIGAGLAAGAAVPGAMANKGWKHLNKRNPTTGEAIGPLARAGETMGRGVLAKLSDWNMPFAKGALDRKDYMKDTGGSLRGYKPGAASQRKESEYAHAANSNPQRYGGSHGRAIWDKDQEIEALQNKKNVVHPWRRIKHNNLDQSIKTKTAERDQLLRQQATPVADRSSESSDASEQHATTQQGGPARQHQTDNGGQETSETLSGDNTIHGTMKIEKIELPNGGEIEIDLQTNQKASDYASSFIPQANALRQAEASPIPDDEWSTPVKDLSDEQQRRFTDFLQKHKAKISRPTFKVDTEGETEQA